MVVILQIISTCAGFIAMSYFLSEVSDNGLLEGIGLTPVSRYVPSHPVRNLSFPTLLVLGLGAFSMLLGVLSSYLTGMCTLVFFIGILLLREKLTT